MEGEIPPRNFILDMPYWMKALPRSAENGLNTSHSSQWSLVALFIHTWPVVMKTDIVTYALKVLLSPNCKTCSLLVIQVFDWKTGFGSQWGLSLLFSNNNNRQSVALKKFSLDCTKISPQNPRELFSYSGFKSSCNFITSLLILCYKETHEK